MTRDDGAGGACRADHRQRHREAGHAGAARRLAVGRLPTWSYVRAALAASWPLVSASFAPLIFLIAAWLLGASAPNAANAGLVAAVAELVLYGRAAGRAAGLKGRQQVALASAAAVLGVVMITLKDVVLVRLH